MGPRGRRLPSAACPRSALHFALVSAGAWLCRAQSLLDTTMWNYECPRTNRFFPGVDPLESFSASSPVECAIRCKSWNDLSTGGPDGTGNNATVDDCNSFHFYRTIPTKCEILRETVDSESTALHVALALQDGTDYYERHIATDLTGTCGCSLPPATCQSQDFCGDKFCFDSVCHTDVAADQCKLAVPPQMPGSGTVVFKQIRATRTSTEGMCAQLLHNLNSTRLVAASNLQECFQQCNGTDADPRPDGTARCSGVQWDSGGVVAKPCTLYDLGVAVPPTTVDETPGFECYRRVYPLTGDEEDAPCLDLDEKCPGWAATSSDECTINPDFMLDKCRRSCGVCTSVYQGQTAMVFLTGYGETSHGKGWRELQLGLTSANPDNDRCQNIGERGTSTWQLPVNFPYPPSSPPWDGKTDRFRVSCVKQTRQCDEAHRANQQYCSVQGDIYSMKVDFFMDCVNDFLGCKAATADDRKNGVAGKEYCFRGSESPLDPAFGYEWHAHLCLQTESCVEMGNNVYAQDLSKADTLVAEREFLTACCSIADLASVPCSTDTSGDKCVYGNEADCCLLQQMCETGSSGARMASHPSFGILLLAILAAMLHVI